MDRPNSTRSKSLAELCDSPATAVLLEFLYAPKCRRTGWKTVCSLKFV
jgi:hypothetical protein